MRLISAAEERLYIDRIVELRGEIERVRTLNAELLDRLMRVQGTAPVQPLPTKPADRITEVIGDIAGSDWQLRKRLGAFVRAERLKKTDEDDIIDAMLNWSEDEAGVPE